MAGIRNASFSSQEPFIRRAFLDKRELDCVRQKLRLVRKMILKSGCRLSSLQPMPGRTAKEIVGAFGGSEAPDLGPGPRGGVQPEVEVDRLLRTSFRNTEVPPGNQRLILALALLWNDHLDAAHSIVQNMSGQDAAFIHGIMHRREPDYGNAKYWFDRVGSHPVFPEIAHRVESIQGDQAGQGLVRKLVRNGKWNPHSFIDACEDAASSGTGGAEALILRQVQRIEMQALMDWLASSSGR
jgi:hypothetical protein